MAKILILEDNIMQAMMLAEFLELEGHALTTSHDFDVAKAAIDADGPFDLVITDFFGPGGSNDPIGQRLIDYLRSHNDTALSSVPIISLSGANAPRLEVKQAGGEPLFTSNLHLVKPVDLGRLLEAVEEYTR